MDDKYEFPDKPIIPDADAIYAELLNLPPPRWEYRFTTVKTSIYGVLDVQEKANARGRDGWELVGFSCNILGDAAQYLLVFKRMLPEG